jgi:hypothetical protein
VAKGVLGVGDGEDFEAVLAQHLGHHVSQEELVLDQQDPRPLCLRTHDAPRPHRLSVTGTQGQRMDAADVRNVSDN